MFVQVLQGNVADPDRLRQCFDDWEQTLAPGAAGWLGSTTGVTDDGRFVALARFESEDAARRNSDRPEQGEWWKQLTDAASGDVTVRDCPDVLLMGNGGDDAAGFVQVMQGRVRDVDRMREIDEEFQRRAPDYRPDVLGGVVALHGDGGYTTAIYFTSEADARSGEAQEPPPELEALMQEERALHEGEVTFLDLREPWLSSPR